IPKLIEVYDEPFADSSALPSLLLNKITKQHVTVALSGDGGDESFIGYKHFYSLLKFQKLMLIPFVVRRAISIFLPKTNKLRAILVCKSENDFIKRIFLGDRILLLNKDDSWVDNYYGDFKTTARNSIQKAADLNIKLWLENDSNVKVDRASMAYSVEVRSPFLDYRIVEYARSLPVSFRYQKNNRKRILKDILEEYIPRTVFNQPKKGFSVPLGDWIYNELKEEVHKILTDDFLMTVPNLDVPKFKNQLAEHMGGNRIYFTNIWKVFI